MAHNYAPAGEDMATRFAKYTTLPRRFVPMVLPTEALVAKLTAVLRAANATSLLSVGSGGRLDLERCVGDTMRGCCRRQTTGGEADTADEGFNLAAVDMVPSGEAVTEGVQYTEVDNHWDRPEIAPGAALMFCWGTLAPWKAYVEAHAAVHGTVILVFSGIDGRVKSFPNPSLAADLALFEEHGFVCSETVEFTGKAFWLNECKLSIFQASPTVLLQN